MNALKPKLYKALASPQYSMRRAALNIVAMLRGPDDRNHLVKRRTVGRIRYFAVKEYPGVVNHHVLSPRERKLRDKQLRRAGNAHMQHHYFWACEGIRRIFGYDLQNECKVTKARRKVL